jgi:DNA-binding transcriptional regulator GbsR (MarR family)
VYELYREEQRDMGFDELMIKTGFSIGQLSIVMLNLELKGLVTKTHGSNFTLR